MHRATLTATAMQPLNPLDAIGPAFARTRLVLFKPFRFGRSWKLATTGYLAFAATFFLPFPLIYSPYIFHFAHKGNTSAATAVTALITISMLLLLGLFYICSRLEFAFFDIVLHRGTHVAPAWRKYGTQTWPWIALKVIFGFLLTLATAAPLTHYFHRFIALTMIKPGQQPPPGLMGDILGFEFGIFGIFAAMFLLGSLLTDFVLPSMALESASLTESFRRFGRLIRREPGQVIGFIGMKIVLGIVGYIAQVVAMYALLLVYLIAALIVFGIGYLVLHALHVPGPAMMVIGLIGLFVTYLFFIFYVVLFTLGVLITFLQSYALYFLGGRYPLIGLALEASTPVVYPPPGYAYAHHYAQGYPPTAYPPQPHAPAQYPPQPPAPPRAQGPLDFSTADYIPTPPPTEAAPMAAEVGAFGEGSGTSGGEGNAEQQALHHAPPPPDEPEV